MILLQTYTLNLSYLFQHNENNLLIYHLVPSIPVLELVDQCALLHYHEA